MNKRIGIFIVPLIAFCISNANGKYEDRYIEALTQIAQGSKELKIAQEQIEAQRVSLDEQYQQEKQNNYSVSYSSLVEQANNIFKRHRYLNRLQQYYKDLIFKRHRYLNRLQQNYKDLASEYKSWYQLHDMYSPEEGIKKLNYTVTEKLLQNLDNCKHSNMSSSECEKLNADLHEILVKPMTAILEKEQSSDASAEIIQAIIENQ